jgi:DNA-directed RNA polymerase specialized sigma24 family protein
VRSSRRYRLDEPREKGDEVRGSTRHQLDELLANSDFLKTVDLIAREVYHVWNVSGRDAYRVVLSAIGEPATLACVHAALSPTPNLPLAKVIIRRRVIDLLRKDARPNNHCSLPPAVEDAEPAYPAGGFDELLGSTPRLQLEGRQVVCMVRTALDGFAAQGDKQHQQAQLLQRYMIDEVGYAALSVELTCSKNALRVRVHKAIMALRRYVQTSHPELAQLVDSRCARPAGADPADPAMDAAHHRPSARPGADRTASPDVVPPFLVVPQRKRSSWARGSDHAIPIPSAAGSGA